MDVCQGLREKGHEVTVLTGIPNYPEGKFYKGYGIFHPLKEVHYGIEIVRIPLIPRRRGKGMQLMLNYLSFAVLATILAPFVCRGSYDIIFTYQLSPVTMSLPAIFLKRLKKAPLIHYVLDLWPESMAAAGGTGEGGTYGLMGKVVSFIYKRCDLILTSSRGFIQMIISRGADPEKVEYWPQWAEDIFAVNDSCTEIEAGMFVRAKVTEKIVTEKTAIETKAKTTEIKAKTIETKETATNIEEIATNIEEIAINTEETAIETKEKTIETKETAIDIEKPVAGELKTHELPEMKPDDFKIVFAGNIGEAQGFGTLLEAAELLKKEKGRSIQWIILGDGRLKSWVELEVNKRGLMDVFHLMGRKPVEEMPYYYGLASALLVSLKNEELFSLTLPAKVQSYLASGKPVIAALNGEGARIVTDADAGFACRGENAAELAKLISDMSRMPLEELVEMGKRGRAYFDKNFSRRILLDKLDVYISQTTNIKT